MIADPPSFADEAAGSQLTEVEDPQGFVSGTPLDRFDSLEEFIAWSRSHCALRTVRALEVQMLDEPVYNLTVAGESYVVPAGITHNCRCHVRAVDVREYKRLVKTGTLPGVPEPILDDDGLPTGHVRQTKVPIITTRPDVPLVPWQNKRTGEVKFIREGIDPGFDKLPGEGRRDVVDKAKRKVKTAERRAKTPRKQSRTVR